MKTYAGSCFCGAVQFSVMGEPAAMGYCHCASCRSWAAAPVNTFTLWKPDALKVTHGAEHIHSYSKTPTSHRKSCRVCGGHLYTDHPLWGVIDVYAACIPHFPYRAGLHVNYQETCLRIKDGLPKLKDMPKEMGGSGVFWPSSGRSTSKRRKPLVARQLRSIRARQDAACQWRYWKKGAVDFKRVPRLTGVHLGGAHCSCSTVLATTSSSSSLPCCARG